jgi:molybdopterin-guanine dinucleotide biosynthesis protein A
MQNINKSDITAVILSGGQGLRMGREDKGLILFQGRVLITYVVAVVEGKVARLLISANSNIEKYQQYGEVISDDLKDFQGPLAGISKALSVVKTPYLLILPCDNPTINQTIITRLIDAMHKNDVAICVANDSVRMHPTIAIIKTNMHSNLSDFLDSGNRKLGLWIQQNNFIKVDFSDYPKALSNLNTHKDFIM